MRRDDLADLHEESWAAAYDELDRFEHDRSGSLRAAGPLRYFAALTVEKGGRTFSAAGTFHVDAAGGPTVSIQRAQGLIAPGRPWAAKAAGVEPSTLLDELHVLWHEMGHFASWREDPARYEAAASSRGRLFWLEELRAWRLGYPRASRAGLGLGYLLRAADALLFDLARAKLLEP